MPGSKTNSPFSRVFRRGQLANCFKNLLQLSAGIVCKSTLLKRQCFSPLFKLSQAFGEFLMAGNQLLRRMKARMISILTAIARALLRTEDNIATPCSVKA